MTTLSQALLPFVRRHFVTLALFSAWHVTSFPGYKNRCYLEQTRISKFQFSNNFENPKFKEQNQEVPFLFGFSRFEFWELFRISTLGFRISLSYCTKECCSSSFFARAPISEFGLILTAFLNHVLDSSVLPTFRLTMPILNAAPW